MRYDSLILDIDGTLWDSRALVAEGYNIQLRAEGYDHLCTDAETLKTLFGKVMTEIADALFSEIPVPERYDLMERCMATENRYLEENPCHIGYEGIRQVLEELAKKYRLFIVSNGQKGYPQMAANKLGLADLMDGYLSWGDTGKSKGQTILQLMNAHNIQSAVYIGDTQGDLEACREANIPFIFTSFGFGQPESYYAKVDQFRDLLEVL